MDDLYNTKRTGRTSRGDRVRATSPKDASPDDREQPADCPAVAMTEAERERRRRFARWVHDHEEDYRLG